MYGIGTASKPSRNYRMTAQRKLAMSSGYALLLMAMLAAFSFGYAFPNFYADGEPGAFVKNIPANPPLYIAMMSALLLIIVIII